MSILSESFGWSQRKKEAAMAKLETSMVAREKEAAAIAKKKEAELQKRSLVWNHETK